MESYYYTISTYKRRALQKVVTIPKFSQLARCVIDLEDHRVKHFKEGFVRIEKCYSGLGPSCNVLLEQFDADRLDGVVVKALKATSQ